MFLVHAVAGYTSIYGELLQLANQMMLKNWEMEHMQPPLHPPIIYLLSANIIFRLCNAFQM